MKTTIHGLWIRWLFFARDWSGADIALELGVSRASVAIWRVGSCTPRPEHQEALRDLVGVTIGQYAEGPRIEVEAVVKYQVG